LFGSDEEEEDEEVKRHHIENYHRKWPSLYGSLVCLRAFAWIVLFARFPHPTA